MKKIRKKCRNRSESLFDYIRRAGYLLLFLVYDKIGENTKVFKKQKHFHGLLIMFHIIIEEIHYYIEETRFILRKAMRGMIYLEKLFEIIF